MSCATSPVLREIVLGGALAREFGKRHMFAVESPAEAIRALCANFPAFRTRLLTSDAAGVGYRVLCGRTDLPGLEALHDPMGMQTLRIVPVLRGASKSGMWQIIAGVALIAGSFIPGLNVALWAGASMTFSGLAFSIGVSLALGGVAQLLAPHPKTQNAITATSYSLNGAVNTIGQGNPVPIGYGEMVVGSAVISAGMEADQVPTTLTGVGSLTAIVQLTSAAGVSPTYQLYASWSPAGLAVAYDVTVQGSGYGPVTLARTSGTSVYDVVPGPGPYDVTVNTVKADGSYGPNASTWSTYAGAG